MTTEVEIIVKTGKETTKFKTKKYSGVLHFVHKEIPAIVKNQEWCNEDGSKEIN